MASAIVTLARGIEEQLNAMVERANLVPGYLQRVVYPTYKNAQRARWENENATADAAGGPWEKLTIPYAERKMREFYDYPGAGQKMLIATSRLFRGVTGEDGENNDHHPLIDDHSIRINVSIDYAVYVDARRNFTQWTPKFYADIYRGLEQYLARNIIKTVDKL